MCHKRVAVQRKPRWRSTAAEKMIPSVGFHYIKWAASPNYIPCAGVKLFSLCHIYSCAILFRVPQTRNSNLSSSFCRAITTLLIHCIHSKCVNIHKLFLTILSKHSDKSFSIELIEWASVARSLRAMFTLISSFRCDHVWARRNDDLLRKRSA